MGCGGFRVGTLDEATQGKATFKLSNFQTFKLFKLSNFQTFKLSNFQTVQAFKL